MYENSRILEPNEEVKKGDLILLVGKSWIIAIDTPVKYLAKDFIEVRRRKEEV